MLEWQTGTKALCHDCAFAVSLRMSAGYQGCDRPYTTALIVWIQEPDAFLNCSCLPTSVSTSVVQSLMAGLILLVNTLQSASCGFYLESI